MASYLCSSGNAPLSNILVRGLAIGIAGGFAEVAVVALYGLVANASVTNVGRHIASAVGLDIAGAWGGLAVHMALAAALGIALMAAWSVVRRNVAGVTSLYLFATGTLASIWGINFFVVLPVLSPNFVTVLPYSVTLFSKVMFGIAAATCLRRVSGVQVDRAVHSVLVVARMEPLAS
jgi:hypothetical protein